jgi:hypothetical protein
MKKKQKIACILIAVGLICYIVNLVVYVPKFSALLQATENWIYTTNPTLSPASYGLDNAAFIISPILIFAAYALVLIGIGYLLAVLVAKVARQLGHLEKEPEITKEES